MANKLMQYCFMFLGAPVTVPLVAPSQGVPGCPPGLEYLTQVDQLLVHQAVELLEGTKIIMNAVCVLETVQNL